MVRIMKSAIDRRYFTPQERNRRRLPEGLRPACSTPVGNPNRSRAAATAGVRSRPAPEPVRSMAVAVAER